MKKIFTKLNLGLLSFSILSSLSLHAQNQSSIDYSNAREGEHVEYCKSHKVMHELQKDPAFAAQFALDQQEMKLKEVEMKNSISPKAVVYKIPIVFHVLHNGGSENITNEQILDALFILNRDFRKQNTDALNVITAFNATNPNATCIPADIEVEFVMATKAPDGTCFNGITRTQSVNTIEPAGGGTAQVTSIRNGNDVFNGEWPGNKYLNIFIAKEIGGAAGYTRLPGSYSNTAMTNGIWILHSYVGAIGTGSVNTSRALTHEVGHWLNLAHTWGPNNNPGNQSSCGSDDDVADTPNTIGVTNCKLNENTCGVLANVENYMDYSYCSKMFSEGQRDRMRAALNVTNTGRRNLWQPANLIATGADGNISLCKAEFTSNREVICAGESVNFEDASYNVVNAWSWSFPGGIPATSTAQNPTITYATPGTYEVVLSASDGSTSQSITKTAYITVLPSATALPFYEGFEGYSQTSELNDKYSIVNSSNNAGWSLTNSAAHLGSKSLLLNNFAQTGTGNYDEFISSSIDLSSVTAADAVTLSFRYAYRKKLSNNVETLKVFLSDDCGENWSQRKTLSGNALSTFAETTSWTPGFGDWVTVHMTNVTSQFWTSNFRFRFRFEGAGGNNIFLDDINIYNGAPSNDIILGVNTLSKIDGLSLYPNPTDGELNVSFNMQANEAMNFVMTDLLGKVVQTKTVQAASGSNLVILSTDHLASGMYLLQIGNETSKEVIQFVVK
ncbi:MAG: M43 family zinc metalloprotease [Crocinitomicaceae bacterium]|nr:M43 family zinc metalloprotease [Crocinitomicaceae bacterium]